MADTDVGGAEQIDRDALAAKYLPRVQAYARRLAEGCPRWVDDVEGEATVGLVKALRNFRGGDFQTYLMQVVRRRCRRKLKHLRRQAATRPAEMPLQEADQRAVPVAAPRELSADTIRVLGPKLAKVVELVLCQGMTHAEASAVLGSSRAAIGVWLKKAAEVLGPPTHWDKT